MKTTHLAGYLRLSSERSLGKKAFTLIELLVVIAIIAILAGILLPSLASANRKAKQIQCLSNLKQQGIGLTMYAHDHNNTLPVSDYGGGGWLWDLSYFTTDAIQTSGGDRLLFRCPGNRIDTNQDRYWRYAEYNGWVGNINGPEPTSTDERLRAYRVVSYSYLFELGSRKGNFLPAGNEKKFLRNLGLVRDASDTEMVVDTTISYSDNSYILPYDPMYKAWAQGTNHEIRGKPIGGSMLFVDGHVSWRRFAQMSKRYFAGDPYFWW